MEISAGGGATPPFVCPAATLEMNEPCPKLPFNIYIYISLPQKVGCTSQTQPRASAELMARRGSLLHFPKCDKSN